MGNYALLSHAILQYKDNTTDIRYMHVYIDTTMGSTHYYSQEISFLTCIHVNF